MDTIYSQPPKIRAPTIRSARPLFADRPAIPPFSQRTNKRVRIFLNSNGLRCGFLTTSILGGWGRLGPLESPGTSTKNGHGGRGAAGPAGGGRTQPWFFSPSPGSSRFQEVPQPCNPSLVCLSREYRMNLMESISSHNPAPDEECRSRSPVPSSGGINLSMPPSPTWRRATKKHRGE
jgi:hypothetical protein